MRLMSEKGHRRLKVEGRDKHKRIKHVTKSQKRENDKPKWSTRQWQHNTTK